MDKDFSIVMAGLMTSHENLQNMVTVLAWDGNDTPQWITDING